MAALTKRQNELIKDNEQRVVTGSFTQFCYNIDYLNGWLYGAVQAINGVMRSIDKGN